MNVPLHSLLLLAVPLAPAAAAQGTLLLDADTPATGSLLETTPLVTAFGTVTFVGEIRSTSDPDLAAAGSVGDVFDIDAPNSDAELFFDFDVSAITFIYGGNTGVIDIEARDAAGVVVDSFFQADTNNGQPAGPETLMGAGIRSLYWTDPGFNFAALDNLEIQVGSGNLGTTYCTPAVANSTGVPAAIFATGSVLVADNDVTLEASEMPQNSFGFFLTSRTQGNVANPGGSQGVLCLGGMIGRYVGPGQIQNAGTAGSIMLAIDLAQIPQPTGSVAAAAGDTWNFQAWFRDVDPSGNATSNFTDAVEIVFQ